MSAVEVVVVEDDCGGRGFRRWWIGRRGKKELVRV